MNALMRLWAITKDGQQGVPVRGRQLFDTGMGRFLVAGNPSAATIDPATLDVSGPFRNRTMDGGDFPVSHDNPNVTSGGGSIPSQDQYVNAGIRDTPNLVGLPDLAATIVDNDPNTGNIFGDPIGPPPDPLPGPEPIPQTCNC